MGCGDLGLVALLVALLVKLGEERYDLALAPRPDDEVYARHLSDPIALQLCVAASHDDECLWVLTMQTIDETAAFLVRCVGHRATVDDADVGDHLRRVVMLVRDALHAHGR